MSVLPARGRRPAAGPPRPYEFPRFSRERLANGLELIVAPVARFPLVTIRVLIRAGAEDDRVAEAGVAHLTATALAEGTTRLDGSQLALAFERLGASLTAVATWEGTQVGTTVLAPRLADAMALLADVVRAPAFAERDVLRLRDERLAELLELRAEPRGLADERFEALLYDSASRYARPEGGDEHTVATLSREACVAFHAQRFYPDATTLIVAGDVDTARVRTAAAHAFGDWHGTAESRAGIVADAARTTRAVHVIGRPGAPQAELRLGHVGLPRAHPDYFPVVVMNAILGGVFNSRLNLNLRERHGYTYGAFSSFDWRRSAGPFVMSAAVATPVTGAAVREMVGELEQMRAAPPRADELSLVTSYLEGVFPIRFETTEAIAAALTALCTFGLPDDYFDTYRNRVRSVTAEQVAAAAATHLSPERLQLTAVGDPETLGPQLDPLHLGPVRYWTPDGSPWPTP